MRILYQYPDAIGPDSDMLGAGPIDAVAGEVERAGLDGLAFTEHPAPSAKWLSAGGHQTLDPFVALSFAAAVTARVRLFTYLSVAAYRNPFLLGKTAASVDLVSGGRLELGLGAGYQKGEFHALGVDFDRRNELMDEALDVLPRFWSGEAVAHDGIEFQARDAICRPRPVQQPIPVWIGGNSRLSLERVARGGFGWMPMMTSTVVSNTTRTAHIGSASELATKIRQLREMAEGRNVEVLVSYLDHEAATPGAPIERHRQAIGDLVEAGATWIGLTRASTSLAHTVDVIGHIAASYR
ncbi:MAG: F420-dependent hydroxymycolic acid dehydrogenase [Actinomycetota bacterium]